VLRTGEHFTIRRDGGTLKVTGCLPITSGQEKTIKRNGRAMALNNGGDTVDLLDPMGKVVQTVTYGHADEGEVITPAP
jgi:hypothetical protein